MNFEDMKKIWDEQHQQHLYVLDEQKLNEVVLNRKLKSKRMVSIIEWLFITVNGSMGAFAVISDVAKGAGNPYVIVLGALMITCALLVYLFRLKRLRTEDRYELSMLGNLDHAIANASHQAALAFWMWVYIVPVAVLLTLGLWYANKPTTWVVGVALFYGIVMILGRWEYRAWHLKRKQRLMAMRHKLTEEV